MQTQGARGDDSGSQRRAGRGERSGHRQQSQVPSKIRPANGCRHLIQAVQETPSPDRTGIAFHREGPSQFAGVIYMD